MDCLGKSKKFDLAETEVSHWTGKTTKRALVLYELLGDQEICINFFNAVISGQNLRCGRTCHTI